MVRVCVEDGFRKREGEEGRGGEGRGGEGREVVVVWGWLEMGWGWCWEVCEARSERFRFLSIDLCFPSRPSKPESIPPPPCASSHPYLTLPAFPHPLLSAPFLSPSPSLSLSLSRTSLSRLQFPLLRPRSRQSICTLALFPFSLFPQTPVSSLPFKPVLALAGFAGV